MHVAPYDVSTVTAKRVLTTTTITTTMATTGHGDSSVMYIPAIPLSRNNFRYLMTQRAQFEAGRPPVDFPGGVGESLFTGRGTLSDIKTEEARRAMGFAPFLIEDGMAESEKRLIEECNRELAAL